MFRRAATAREGSLFASHLHLSNSVQVSGAHKSASTFIRMTSFARAKVVVRGLPCGATPVRAGIKNFLFSHREIRPARQIRARKRGRSRRDVRRESGTGILPVRDTAILAVEAGARRPCDTWARCPCHVFNANVVIRGGTCGGKVARASCPCHVFNAKVVVGRMPR